MLGGAEKVVSELENAPDPNVRFASLPTDIQRRSLWIA
jgi:hypothetical protein